MKMSKRVVIACACVSAVFLGAASAYAKSAKWSTIIGIIEVGNRVGSGDLGFGADPGGVLGGAPWSTLGGGAKVDLDSGDVQFQVKGLVLAVGSAPTFGLTGLPIGTTAGVTDVMGTLVCDVDGSASGGTSTLVDTPSVTLSTTGDAQFSGSFGTLPAVCSSETDTAFLLRIVNPEAFRGVWIANGAVLNR
jgi:hypothetical protein